MGEGFGNFSCGRDEDLINYIDACNIACGFHAGDPVVIDKTIHLALKNDKQIGAHPSYPDLQGFGRRTMKIAKNELRSMLRYQIAALKSMTESSGGKIRHVKPHGALYNDAYQDLEVCEAIIEAVLSIDEGLEIFAPFHSLLSNKAIENNIQVRHEAFADRRYNGDGRLVSRHHTNACIESAEEAVNQVSEIIQQHHVKAVDGTVVTIVADTFCVHSDGRRSLEILQALHDMDHD